MNKKFLFAVIAATVMGNAWADDGRILTTQTYVDNELSGKVDIAQGTGDNNANVGKTLVVNQQGNLELGAPAAANYIEDSITDGVTNKAPSENAVHDALADKQDTINGHAPNAADSILTDTQHDGIIAKRAIYDGSTQYTSDTRSHIPTTGAVVDALEFRNVKIPRSGKVRTNGLVLEDISNYASPSVKGTGLVTKTSTDGLLGERLIYEANIEYTGAYEQRLQIPTVGAVYDGLDTRQAKKVCVRWLDTPEHPEHTDENCLLWDLPD